MTYQTSLEWVHLPLTLFSEITKCSKIRHPKLTFLNLLSKFTVDFSSFFNHFVSKAHAITADLFLKYSFTTFYKKQNPKISHYQWDLLPLQIQPLSIQDSCQNPQTKDTLLRSYFWLTVCKYPYFSQKLRKHCLVQNADVGKQNLPTLMASEIAVIRKPDFMDPMNLFPSDAKVTCTCQQDCTYKYIWDGLKSNYVNY